MGWILWVCILLLLALAGAVSLWCAGDDDSPDGPNARWEAVLDDDGCMIRVRWSRPDEEGRYLWIAHYPASAWGLNAAEGHVKRLNAMPSFRDGTEPAKEH